MAKQVPFDKDDNTLVLTFEDNLNKTTLPGWVRIRHQLNCQQLAGYTSLRVPWDMDVLRAVFKHMGYSIRGLPAWLQKRAYPRHGFDEMFKPYKLNTK